MKKLVTRKALFIAGWKLERLQEKYTRPGTKWQIDYDYVEDLEAAYGETFALGYNRAYHSAESLESNLEKHVAVGRVCTAKPGRVRRGATWGPYWNVKLSAAVRVGYPGWMK